MIVDTPVWSAALRRGDPDPALVSALKALIEAEQAILLGCVLQEILSGIRVASLSRRLESKLSLVGMTPTVLEDYTLAAVYSNQCRSKGIQGSNTDFLVCAVATRLKVSVWTHDKDFERYAEALPVVARFS